MDIQYLVKLKENIKIGLDKSRGVSEVEIQRVEAKFNINFLQAYKEFLYLAGEYPGALLILDTCNLADISHDEHQKMMWEEIERSGIKFERPFWLFAQSEDCEQFWFFYLDEQTDDPNVYAFEYANDWVSTHIRDFKMTFSDLILRQIDVAIEDAKYS